MGRNERKKYLDKIRGSLIGGAVGDALGYSVEFLSENEIFEKYGKNGITEYELVDGVALISDDTQMTLFTANGILVGETRLRLRGIGGNPVIYVPDSYQDWLLTQTVDFETGENIKRSGNPKRRSWLMDVQQLYSKRAPGLTCLSALETRKEGFDKDYLNVPINDSKGCGGIMRVAPLGLHYEPVSPLDIIAYDVIAAELSAITHGHSLGYMPSAVLTHILNRIVYPFEKMTLKEIVFEAIDTVEELFSYDENINALKNIVNLAIELSENKETDLENIKKLGEGWVAEETLAIAIYCSLKYEKDFSKGIIASVNHSGDSDSTGAVTGNILGAICGYESIDKKWKENLELKDVIMEMADDLCYGCQMREYDEYRDPDWVRKYIHMKWRDGNIQEEEKEKEYYKKILETEYKGKKIYQHLKDGGFTVTRAYVGNEYKNSNSKLMVVGRAMNGWERDFSKISISEIIDTLYSEEFDFSDVVNPDLSKKYTDCKYNYIRSKFWKLIRFLLKEYDDANEEWYNSDINKKWNEKIVWSNLYKVSPKKSGNPPWRMMGENIEEYINILKEEIKKYKPERILLVTDNNYLQPNANKLSFFEAFNISKCESGNIVGRGIYENKKIIVCKRPDRWGMSDAKICQMALEIKKEFDA